MATAGQRRARPPTRVLFVPPSRHLLCSLCEEQFNEVVLPCAGGHTFCRACVVSGFERQRSCPVCVAPIPTSASLAPNRLALTLVDELRVRCRFGVKEEGDMWVADETGCPAQLTLDGAAAHEAACSFTTTTCPFAGCGVELHLNQSDSHDAAFAVAHARGERAARVLSEARLAAVESSAASTRAFFEARLAAEQASAASARVLSEARLAAVEASVTSTRVDLRDERAARLAVEANAAVMASRIASLETSAASMRAELDTQRAALEARLSMVEQRMSTVGIGPVVLPMRSDGWSVRHIIGKAAADVGTARKPILCCALSPDISLVCVGLYDDDGTLMLLDVASGGLCFTLDGHEDAVNSCAFSPDGATLVSASLDNTVKLWNVASGDTVRTLQGHTSWAWYCAFSPDGRSIVSGSYDKSLKLWNAATGGCKQSLDGLAAWVRSCAYSADGMMVLSGSMDNKLKLWSVATGMCIRTFKGHTGAVSGCSFSPANGNIILSASFDKTLKLWDATTGVCRCTLTGHSGFVRGCAFSPVHGNLALSCSEDKNLHLWDTATGACTATLQGQDNGVLCCAVSRDGTTIASGDDSGEIKIWMCA